MKQKRKENLPVNAFIGTPEQISEISQNLYDVHNALETNAVIIKDRVAKQRRLLDLKEETLKELKDIPNELLDAENWDELKKSTVETAESVRNTTINEIKDANEHLTKFAKSAINRSSKILSEGKGIISVNTPKVSKSIGKSIRGFFERKQSFTSKDLELLKQLAELKQQGVISAKEFSAKKKKILAKL